MSGTHPEVSEVDAIVKDKYGLSGPVRRLDGEYDLNFFVGDERGHAQVLKIMRPGCEDDIVALQIAAMDHVMAKVPSLPIPRVVPRLDGDRMSRVQVGGENRLIWALSALPGKVFGLCRPFPQRLLQSLGGMIGSLDNALEDFNHAALQRELKWNLLQPHWILASLSLVELGRRKIIETIMNRFLEIEKTVAALPRQAIHNDINDYNILIGLADEAEQTIGGIIDFGDVVEGPVICELAIACAYLILDAEDPLEALCLLVAGYHEIHPLSDVELECLFPLLLTRLAVSVVNSALAKAERPDDPYVSVTEQGAWSFLGAFASLSERAILTRLRHACGLSVAPNRDRVLAWISSWSDAFLPVVEGLDRARIADGSLWAIEQGGTHDDPDRAPIAISRYAETRLRRSGPSTSAGFEPVNGLVHLGLDIDSGPGRPVAAPLSGIVVRSTRVQGSANEAIVIGHETDDGTPFQSRFSGLRLDHALEAGARVEAGQPLGETIGQRAGDAPLTFQLSVVELPADADWPLDVQPGEASAWQEILANPAPFLGLSGDDLATRVSTLDQSLARRRRVLGSNLRLSYDEPLQMARGWRHHLFSSDGRCFLDAYNNVPHVGHSHPRVIDAAVRQMKLLNTNTRYVHDAPIDYADALTARLPEPLSVCFLLNSASEANELALRLARAITGARDMLVMEQGYHGNTNAAIDVSAYKFEGPGGLGKPDWVHVVPLADPYRGAFKGYAAPSGTLYADQVREKLAELANADRSIAGFICETLPSVGGQIVFPDGYLKQVYAAVRKAGGVCIADEVQTGLGRLGAHAWGFATQDAIPDIVVLGKPIGNGHPMAAVITTPDIAAAFDNGMEFFSTFGGNTVSAAVGLEVLRVLDDEGLQDNALKTGQYLHRALEGLRQEHEIIGDVRGLGLFLGVELVTDRTLLAPATDVAHYVVNRLRQEGILVGTEGRFHNILKLRPPLTFDRRASDQLGDVLDQILREDFVCRATS